MNGAVTEYLSLDELQPACEHLVSGRARMQMAYARFAGKAKEVIYLADPGPLRPFVVLRCQLPAEINTLPSFTTLTPLLGWYEREIQDLCGIRFTGHPEPYPLVLHEGAAPPMPPLDPEYQLDRTIPFHAAPWILPEVVGKDVQRLPYGPIRADVLESAQILFLYIGEGILHCHPRLFFKHRGLEKKFEGLTPEMGVLLAERISGVDSVHHALAFCEAIEGAANCEVPERARYLRVLLCEMERIYNHLHYLGHLCHTTSLKVGEAEGKLLEERAKQLNAKLTGSRFLRSLLTPGGLRKDLNPVGLGESIRQLWQEIRTYMDILENTNSHLDRLITTGRLPKEMAYDQGATGPIKRASGIDRDLRRDHPYAAYEKLPVNIPVRAEGDAHAREQVRMAELEASVSVIGAVLDNLPDGPIQAACRPQGHAEGLGWAEAPRGSVYYAVHFNDDGRLARVKVKSSSFSNWRVFPFTVHDSNMMDYAINEASFGLTMAGCDR